MHAKSKNITIRNLLLIRQNQVFDSLLVKESERLVRSQVYVHDVSFFIKSTATHSDSVDIFIRELDNWSIIPNGNISISSFSIGLTDKNFAGFGHEFQQGFTRYYSPGGYDYHVKYYIPNIRNSYVNSTLYYSKDQFKNSSRSFAVDRPFFSSLANWAAGVYFAQQYGRDSILTNNSSYVQQQFKFNVQDYWVGNAVQIFKGNAENSRTTKFITTLRYLRIRYLEKPIAIPGLPHIHANENFYLASIGISRRKYVMDKYIFKYGTIEDVPIGKIFNLTGGYQEQNTIGRLYLGARIAMGNYYSWGYLSTNFEYGTFIRASQTQQSIFTASINYFTGLVEIGNWKFRQFAKPQVILGINRFSNERITLNDGYGLNGFNSPELLGISRLLFTLQTQSYAPWNFIGFRFGPFIIWSLGMLGSPTSGFKNSKVYSQFGLGVILKNEHLIISTFQISIAFYPRIPGTGNNVFKLNSIQTADFGFKDFAIGKPSVVAFQ